MCIRDSERLVEQHLMAVSMLVERDPKGDPPDPALQRPLAAESILLPQRPGEGLLHRVVRPLEASANRSQAVSEGAEAVPVQKLELFG